jgi:hypothetical protein
MLLPAVLVNRTCQISLQTLLNQGEARTRQCTRSARSAAAPYAAAAFHIIHVLLLLLLLLLLRACS